MSKFYGTLQGERPAKSTRCGRQGMTTQAASWAGAIEVRLFTDRDGIERFEVEMIQWRGEGDRQLICAGRVGDSDSIILHENIGMAA